jgi:hypothetical protein
METQTHFFKETIKITNPVFPLCRNEMKTIAASKVQKEKKGLIQFFSIFLVENQLWFPFSELLHLSFQPLVGTVFLKFKYF